MTNFDLEERTAKFGEEVIKLCKTIKHSDIAKPIINQLVRYSTSIGANYMEANGASSKRDFGNKIRICLKETRETKHWLRMLAVVDPSRKDKIRLIWKECQELTLIFSKITATLKNGN